MLESERSVAFFWRWVAFWRCHAADAGRGPFRPCQAVFFPQCGKSSSVPVSSFVLVLSKDKLPSHLKPTLTVPSRPVASKDREHPGRAG